MRHLVKFLVPDELPIEGIVRMQYYVESEGNEEVLHFGTSPEPVEISMLRDWAKKGEVIELPHSILLSAMQDLYLGQGGAVYVADAIWPGEKRQVYKI